MTAYLMEMLFIIAAQNSCNYYSNFSRIGGIHHEAHHCTKIRYDCLTKIVWGGKFANNENDVFKCLEKTK